MCGNCNGINSAGDHSDHFCNYDNHRKVNYFGDLKNSFKIDLDVNERIELENLRKQNKILMDLCLPEKIEAAWNYGWQSRQFAGSNNSLELKNELWLEDKESIIEDELESLEKGDDF